jgi:sigma-B regulation protein RsbU (phosphoserine phosphatase)
MSSNIEKQSGLPTPESATLFFTSLMELLPDHVYFKDREGCFLCVNRAMARFFNISKPEEMLGKTDYDLFERSLAEQKDKDEREIVRTGLGFIGKIERGDSPEGERWVLTTKLPLFDADSRIIGTFGISRDITDMKKARDGLESHHRLLKTLIEILPCRIFVKDQFGRIQLTNQAYRESLGILPGGDVLGKRLEDLVTDPRLANVSAEDMGIIETGEPILNREQYDASPISDKRWTLLSKVPLLDSDGKVKGIVGMSADITAQKESEARALQAQRELEAKNLQIESELDMAREMQMELMAAGIQSVKDTVDLSAPFAPQILFAYEPCEHLAGDFFQAVPLSRQLIGILVCDVMGHGVKAALVTTLMRGLLAEMTARTTEPALVLSSLNERLCVLLDRPSFPRFVTGLYATIDIQKGVLCVANAGHPWPLILGRDGEVRCLTKDACCPALGLMPGSPYASVEVPLKTGDRVFLYTDGLKEELNSAGEEYGAERLASSLALTEDHTPPEALHHILKQVRAFSGSESSGDDLCAVMLSF